MNSSTIQEKICFFKEKIAICHQVKAQILPDDPYRDYKRMNMENRISLYSEELKKLQPENLKNWFV